MKNKQSHNNSQKALKPKYLQKSNRPNKIMITDLCPQEKVKIGQLIKTLQNRKKQNMQLQNQIRQRQETIHIVQQKLNQLQKLFNLKEKENQQQKQQLQNYQKIKIQKDIELQELLLRLKQLEIRKNQKILINTSTNTDKTTCYNIEVQTQFKKKKNKHKQIQVQILQELALRKNLQFYRPNSKSFLKIMKDFKNIQNSRYTLQKNKNNSQSKLQNKKRLTVQELQNENKYDQIQQIQAQNQNMEIQDTDDDQYFEKFLQWKQNNYYNILNKNKDKKNQKESSCQQFYLDKNQESEIQISQIQLNKALKSKNFSASRIINNSQLNSSRQNQKKNSQKRQKAFQNAKTEFQQKKNDLKNLKQIYQQQVLEKSSKNVDFYSSDIMDIVESLNP